MPFLLHIRNRPHEMISSIKADRKGGVFTTQTDSLCASWYLHNQMKSGVRRSSLLGFLRRFGIWIWSLWSTKTERSLWKISERFLWFSALFFFLSTFVLPAGLIFTLKLLVAFVDIPAPNCATSRRWVWILAWLWSDGKNQGSFIHEKELCSNQQCVISSHRANSWEELM